MAGSTSTQRHSPAGLIFVDDDRSGMVLDILCRAALLALCCVTTSTSAQSTPATELKIATFNIRGADINESPDPPVDLAADEEYPWAWRGYA